MSDLVTTSFVSPTSQIALAGEMGLTLHDIALSLGARFSDAKKKLNERGLIERMQVLGFTTVAFAATIDSGTYVEREIDSYVFDVNAAKFFVAKYNNEIGDAYLAYLIKQEKKGHTLDELINNPLTAVALFQQMATDKAKLEALAAERDQAIRRGNFITDNRTATALANASTHARQLRQLQASNNYIKDELLLLRHAREQYPQLNSMGSPSRVCHMLGRFCAENGYDLDDVPELAAGIATTLKIYPRSAIVAFLEAHNL